MPQIALILMLAATMPMPQSRIHHQPDFTVRTAPVAARPMQARRAHLIAQRRAAIEREAAKQRRADGGRLTPAHLAYFQTRLAELNGALTMR